MDPSISSLASHNNKTMKHQQELQNWGMIPSTKLYQFKSRWQLTFTGTSIPELFTIGKLHYKPLILD